MKITVKDEFDLKRDEIIKVLRNQFIYPEITDDGDLSFSLIQLGLSGVYATISKEEIQYHVENDEE